jgi:hypothetical protein
MNAVSNSVFTCDGCGEEHFIVHCTGLWVRPSTLENVEWRLCQRCASALDHDSQRMLTIIELRLGSVRGHA